MEAVIYNRDRVPKKRQHVDFDNFSIGSPSNRKAKKAARLARKQQRADDRSYKKRAKADALAKRYSGKAEAGIIAAQGEAAANMALAQQGIQPPPPTMPTDLGQQALGAVSGLLGGGQLQDSSIGLTTAEDYEDGNLDVGQGQNMQVKKAGMSPTMMLIIAGIGIGAFFLMKKK